MIALTPVRGRIVLFLLVCVSLAGILEKDSIPPPPRDTATSVGDENLQLWTIERIRRGEPYYAAVGDELRKHQYPTIPLINWRTPLHYKAVATLSVERAGTLLFVLAMTVVVTAALAYSQYSVAKALSGALFLLAAMAPAMLVRPGATVFPEIWAGVLVGLSLNSYVAKLWVPAASLGVLAVFTRELAAPYALVCGLLALRARRRNESLVWIAGGVLYVIYFAVHANAAMAAVQPGDLVREDSYMRFLGLPFLFMTLYTYGGLTILPAVATPIAASLGLMAAWAKSAPHQLRLSLLVYFAVFCAVGQPFNFYWGFFTCSLWGHAFVHSFEGGQALVRAARGRPDPRDAGSPEIATA